jgi:NTE family protein
MFRKLVHSVRAFRREFAQPHLSTSQPPVIGLALGGGFARGLAHIGVLKVLEEENIPIQFVAGTSVGAIIGAAYCSGISPTEMEEIASLVRFKDFARWTLSRLGFASNDRMRTFLEHTLRLSTFEALKIPLAVTATDFVSGDAVVFRSGPLVDAVRASCAYPGIFLPVEIDGKLLVDGMLAHGVPTIPVREMGANRVIAVYLNAQWGNLHGPRHVFDVIGQCFSIAQQKMCGPWQAAADLVITPDVRGFSYDSFERAAELRRAGEDVTRRALPTIREWLHAPAQSPAVPITPAQVSPARS